LHQSIHILIRLSTDFFLYTIHNLLGWWFEAGRLEVIEPGPSLFGARREVNFHLPDLVLVPSVFFRKMLEEDLALLEEFSRLCTMSVGVMILEHLPLNDSLNPESHCTTVSIIVVAEDGFRGISSRLGAPAASLSNRGAPEQDLCSFERITRCVRQVSKPFQDQLDPRILRTKPNPIFDESPGLAIHVWTIIDCIQPAERIKGIQHIRGSFLQSPQKCASNLGAGALISETGDASQF